MTIEFIKKFSDIEVDLDRGTVATIGAFDGIHLGHQAILKIVQEDASLANMIPALITFHPHPREVITPEHAPHLLTTIEEKVQFLPDFFGGRVLALEFNEALQELSAERFVRDVLVGRFGLKRLIIGYDHHLGRDRSGGASELTRLGAECGFDVKVVDPVMCGDKPISSSRIRNALIDGTFRKAVELLGHEYAIFGTVMRGIGLGRKLGYPTANVRYNERKLLPQQGVYACWAEVDGQSYCGMMFIGHNHFNPEAGISVEANLFNFDRDIYDREIFVYPVDYVRENRRFDSPERLAEQIAKDKNDVMEILSKEKKDVCGQNASS